MVGRPSLKCKPGPTRCRNDWCWEIPSLVVDGTQTIADQQTSSWEEADGRRFRFNSTDARDGKSIEDIAGDAARVNMLGHIVVELTRPTRKDLTLPARIYFPTQHVIALLTAAKMG